ncbi:hypothetical protein PQX77_012028 [Marasmius sp. AFHP31]|nr:hypothetical protein PQX77_012028 [Marasmius sp. AFHP31]
MEPMCSSEGFDMDEFMDVDDENASEAEDDFDDEVLRRVMLNDNRKLKHKYRLSYYATCGDSFDPDIEDVEQWENELQELEPPLSEPPSSQIDQLTPEDLEDAELEAYVDDWERQKALADFVDIPAEELFNWDEDDLNVDRRQSPSRDMEL